MRQALALIQILLVALAVTGAAHKKDFSGTWNIDQAATDTANPPADAAGRSGKTSRPTGFAITIRQTADSFAIERRGGDGGAPVTTTYKLDGIERDVRTGSATAKAKAKWDGDTIAIEAVRTGDNGAPVTTVTTYALDKDSVLWVETKAAQGYDQARVQESVTRDSFLRSRERHKLASSVSLVESRADGARKHEPGHPLSENPPATARPSVGPLTGRGSTARQYRHPVGQLPARLRGS